MSYRHGNAPDTYMRTPGTLTLRPNEPLAITDASTGLPVAGLLDATMTAVTSVSTDASGEYDFYCDSPVIMITSAGRTWGPLTSSTLLASVAGVLPHVEELAGAASTAAAAAVSAETAAEAAQAAAEAAAAGAGAGGVDGSKPATITATWDFAAAPTVPAPTADTNPATRAYVDAVGTAAATSGAVVKRDANGRAQVAVPSAQADIANKAYVDGAGTSQPTPNTLARHNAATGAVGVGTPTDAAHAVPLSWAQTHILGAPAIDATAGTAVPDGTPAGTIVMRLATPAPAPAWSAFGETTSGAVPVSWAVPANAVPGQTVVVAAVMAGTGTWTAPSGASTLYASQQGAGCTIAVYAVTVTSGMLGTSQQVTASTIPAGTRAQVVALAYDGVTVTGATLPTVTVQGTATASPSIPGTDAAGAGVLVGLLAGRLTAVVADGAHWTWPSGWTEQHDDAVATTSSVSTVSVTAATKVVDVAASAAAVAPTSDLGATQYLAVQIFLPAIEAAVSSGSATAGAGTTEWLRTYGADPVAMLRGTITLTPLGCPLSGAVAWPFGAGTGTFTGVPSTDLTRLVGWTVTFVPAGGGTTKTVTQPTMTLRADGAVTARPELTVA